MIEYLGVGAAASTAGAFAGGKTALSPGAKDITKLFGLSKDTGIKATTAIRRTNPLYRTAPIRPAIARRIWAPGGETKITIKSATLIGRVIQDLFKGVSPKTIQWWLTATAGSIGIGYWGKTEALRESDFAYQNALKTGDPQLITEVKNIRDDIFNTDLYEKIARGLLMPTPGAGISGISDKFAAAKAQGMVTDWNADPENQGLTLSEEIIKTKEKTIEMQEESTKKFNEDRIATEEIILTLRSKAAEEADKRARTLLKEQIAAWTEFKEAQRKAEAYERELIAQFWLEYIKRKKELMDDYGRSNLGFGLL